jgi:protocatechuate 3,4-dioxygenase beta subunit
MSMIQVLCIVVVLASGAQAARQDGAQAKGPPKPATITGRITDAATGQPIRMARVRIALDSRTERIEFTSRTEDDGRYSVDDVPAGRYVVTVSKARYVQLQHGQRLPAAAGRPVDVAAGATQQVDVALPRASAITGRVADEFGDPIERATVSAMKVGYANGRRGFVSAGGGQTNDAGEYRIPGLSPGSYYILASERAAGFGVDGDADVGFMQTMYPAATTAAEARTVTVNAGQDLRGIDLSMTAGRTAILSGLAVSSRGQPAAKIRMNLAAVDAPFGLGGETSTTADGRFTFPRVLPGRYELHARKPGFSNRPGDEPEGAIVPIIVSGTDILDLPVPLTRGGRLTGTVVPPEGSTATPKDVALVASPVGDTLVFGVGFGEALKDDWTFDWPFLIAPRVVRAQRVPPGWYVSAVLRGDDDIVDTPTLFREPDEVRIVLSADAAQLTGTVTGSDGKPADDYTAILFPEDASQWTVWSRFIRTARPDQKAQFTFDSMPPGQYLVAAVAMVERDQWLYPEFLKQLRAVATRVTLEPAGRQTIRLRVVTP